MKQELRTSIWIRLSIFLCCLLFLQACADGDGVQDIEERGLTLEELLLRDARSCVYNPEYPQELIDGLSNQLIEELRCMNPNWLEFYESCQEVGCIFANGPQPHAARPEVLVALRAAALAEGDYISINAAYRDVAMQYFSRWYKENCSSSFPAAIPGNSNHQGGRAIDVNYYNFWWDALIEAGFEHPLVNDNPHFELVGDAAFRNESEQLKSLGVLAFQRLHNRNFPNDQIGEDGVYGPATKQRLGDSPVAGFVIGACEFDDGGEDATDGDTDSDGGAIDADVTPDVDASDTDVTPDTDAVDGDVAPDADTDSGDDTTDDVDGSDVTPDSIADTIDTDDASDDSADDAIGDASEDDAVDAADADAGSDVGQPTEDVSGPSDDAGSPSTSKPPELRDQLVYSGGGGGCSSTGSGAPPASGGLVLMLGLMVLRRKRAWARASRDS